MGLLVNSLVGGLAVGMPLLVLVLIMDRVLGKASMGGGDLKLLAVAGMYFGWAQCIFLLMVACVLGIVVALIQMRSASSADAGGEASSALSVTIPWGPSIAVACWVTMLVGRQLLAWYLGLF